MTPVPAESWPSYCDQVWTAFLALNGNPCRMAGPQEWSIMLGWLQAGYPLRVVLRGLEDVRGGKGASLAYYAPAVEDAYAHFRTALGGWA